jgi:hypothetical protein
MSQRSMSRGTVNHRVRGSVPVVENRIRKGGGARGRGLWLASLLVTALFWSAAANAAAKPTVAVLAVGPGAEAVRAEVVAALPSSADVVDKAALTSALSQRHIAVTKALKGGQRSQAFISAVHSATIALGADAVILVEARARKGKPSGEYVVVAVAASQQDAAIDTTVTIESDADRGDQWKKALGPLLDLIQGGAKAAEPAEKGAVPEKTASPEATSNENGESAASPEQAAEVKGEPAPLSFTNAMFTGFLGLDFGGRQFHYNERVTNDNLRPFDLPAGVLLPVTPGIAASVEFFPLAKTDLGIVRDIGVSGRFGINWAQAKLGNAVSDVDWHSWELNLRGRILLGPRAASPVIGVELGGGELAFGFHNPDPVLESTLPGVDYHYLRVAVDGRIPLGPGAILLGAAYRPILGAGDLGSHFPRESISGMDAKLGAALKLTSAIEARLVFTYTRVWATFNPRPGDQYIAGGGVDQLLNADIGAAIRF